MSAEADEPASLRARNPRAAPGNEDKPTSGTLAGTAYRLSGIRARDNAAESDEAMASNDDKKKARELLAANPGMKYTEALRTVQRPRITARDVVAPLAPQVERDELARDCLRGADPSAAIRDVDLPPGSLDPFALASNATALTHAGLAEVFPGSRLGKVESTQTAEGAFLYRSDELDPLNLRVGGNMLLVAPPGTGGEGLVRGLVAANAGAGSEVRIVIPSSARPEMRSNWPGWVTLCEDTSKDDLARIATTTRQEAKGRAALFLEEPEHFAERDAWWSAIAPRLADPRTAVIVRTASAHTIPGELRNSFAVKAVMGYAATDPAEVTRTVEEVPDRERAWSELGKDGAGLVLQDGEVTGFTVSERAG